MKKYFVIILISGITLLYSCKSEKQSANVESEFAYPALPDSLRTRMNNECTQIEYLFSQGFSASSSSKSAVIEGIDHTDDTPVPKTLLSKCKPIGRNQFLAGFNIILEADIYYAEPDCAFFIYKRKGTPLYSGMLKENGKKFFASVINSANPYGNQQPQ